MARGSLPLPPAAVLSDYNEEFPGLVDKIVQWTDDQRQHRMTLEMRTTIGAEKRMDRGQLIAAGVWREWGCVWPRWSASLATRT